MQLTRYYWIGLDWIIDQAEHGASLEVTKPEHVQAICNHYAATSKRDVADIALMFHNEYCSGRVQPDFRPYPVNMRVRELIGEYGIKKTCFSVTKADIKKQLPIPKYKGDYSDLSLDELIKQFQANDAVQKLAVSLGAQNISKKIDELRKILSRVTGDEQYSLKLMKKITLKMHQANLDETSSFIKMLLSDDQNKSDLETCLKLVSDIIGMKKFSKDNDEKLIYLADAYKSLANAMKQMTLHELAHLNTPKEILDAHVQLLQGAIDRNKASMIRQVCFAIKDFCSTLFELITCGLWKSDVKRINVISAQFKDAKGNISTAQLNKEQSAIKTILMAKATLEQELGEDLTSGIKPVH
jgi:hypothetical protein